MGSAIDMPAVDSGRESAGASIERVRAALEQAQHGPGRTSGAWTQYRCPAHEDNVPSVGVKYDAQQQKTVVRCFAGCADEQILSAVGLTVRDLFDNPIGRGLRVRSSTPAVARRPATTRDPGPAKPTLGPATGPTRRVAIYSYTDERGIERGEVVRTVTPRKRGPEKGFYQRRV